MAENFDMVGRLFLGKETEKFKPYEERGFDSGWQRRTLKFNCGTGNSVHFLQIQGGCQKDGSSRVYFYDKEEKTRASVPFADRKKVVEKAAEWNKFVIDLFDKPRYLVDKVLDKGSITEEEKKILGAESLEEVKALKEKASKMRKEFVSGWDFAKVVHDILSKEEYKDKKFRVKGDIEIQYYNGKFYQTLSARKIYLVDDKTEESAVANIHLMYAKESLDEEWENGKFRINGWVPFYDTNTRKTQFAPFCLTLKASDDPDAEKAKKIDQIRVKRFKVEDDDEVCEFGIVANMINGTEIRRISEDDLTEEQKDALYCGDITLKDIQRELGDVAGERVSEYQFSKIMAGYSTGAKPSAYRVHEMEYQFADEEDDDDVSSLDLSEDDDELFDWD